MAGHKHGEHKHDEHKHAEHKQMAKSDNMSKHETMAFRDKMDMHQLCNAEPGEMDFVIEQGDTTIWLQVDNAIRVSEPVSLTMPRCGSNNTETELSLDALMPAHGHGMNYQPEITEIARDENGVQYRVEGLVLHMPGNWQWNVDVTSSDGKDTLQREFRVE